MSSRTLSSLLILSLLAPQMASAYFPKDVMLPPIAPTHTIPEEEATPEAAPAPLTQPPALPAILSITEGWNSDMTIKRSVFLAALVRRLYKPSERCFLTLADSDFSLLARDVEKDAPYGIDLCTAMRAGIMRGDEMDRFRPNDILTRAEAAKALAKAYGLAFDPTDPAQPWFENYVNAFVKAGAMDRNANVNAPITRDELSRMFWAARDMERVAAAD